MIVPCSAKEGQLHLVLCVSLYQLSVVVCNSDTCMLTTARWPEDDLGDDNPSSIECTADLGCGQCVFSLLSFVDSPTRTHSNFMVLLTNCKWFLKPDSVT